MRWLEETRLHEDDLYLPSLSPQYDENRLAKNIQPKQVCTMYILWHVVDTK